MELINGEEEWVVEEIVDLKWHCPSTCCPLHYKVHWLGYQDTPKYKSWVLATSVDRSPEAVAEFHAKYPNKKPRLEFFPPDWKNKKKKQAQY